MSVSNGQAANSTTFNNAFASKLEDNEMAGVQSLNNIGSDAINDVQASINQLFEINGTFEGQSPLNQYTSNAYITDGDSTVVAASKLDAQVSLMNGPAFFSTYAEKTTPVSDDIVLIEDSENSFSKKKLKLTNMIGGGSAGSGGINYISNGEATTNTSGWATYADAAGSLPVDGTGGAPTITFTRSTSLPLRGAASFLFSKDAANRQGEGASYDFTIDSADKAKVLQISFDYEVISGTYADGDLTCYILDVTNSRIIQPAGFSITNVIGPVKQLATFQSSSDSTSYRLILHCASTSALAYGVKLDNVITGPQVTVNGAMVTDYKQITATSPTIGVNVAISATGRRSGDRLEAYARMDFSGTNTQGLIQFSFPGYSFDSSKLIFDSSGQRSAIGSWVYRADSGALFSGNVYCSLAALGAGTIELAGIDTSTNTPATINNGAQISCTFSVPVLGWSSNVQLSSETDSRVVAMTIYQTTAAISANTAYAWNGAKVVDTHNAMNGPGGEYTVPVPGVYEVSVHALTNAATDLGVAKNGIVQIYVASVTSSMNYCGGGTTLLSCVTGDKISIFGNTANTMTGAYSSLSIRRTSGLSTIAASETVIASYVKASGQTISNATLAGGVTFDTMVVDSHGSYNNSTGDFTVKSPGKYKVTVFAEFTTNATGHREIISYKNGVDDRQLVYLPASSGIPTMGGGSAVHDCIADDMLSIKVYQDSGGNLTFGGSGSRYNHITIERIGN